MKCYHGINENECAYAHYDPGSICGQCGSIPAPNPQAPGPDRDALERARELLKSEPLSDYDRDKLAPKIAAALAAERERALEDAARAAQDACHNCYCAAHGDAICATAIRTMKGTQ